MNEQFWWHLSRATGIVGFFTLAAVMILGLLLATRIGGSSKPPPAWSLGLHRMLGLTSLILAGVHMVSLYADSYVEFTVADLLIPFAADWQPIAVAWGVLAFYLLLAVQVSSWLMNRLPKRLWRVIHFSAYALFWITAIHGATAGTDAGHPAYIVGSLAAVVVVLFLTAYRALTPRWVAKRERATARTAREGAPPRAQRSSQAAPAARRTVSRSK